MVAGCSDQGRLMFVSVACNSQTSLPQLLQPQIKFSQHENYKYQHVSCGNYVVMIFLIIRRHNYIFHTYSANYIHKRTLLSVKTVFLPTAFEVVKRSNDGRGDSERSVTAKAKPKF